MFNKKNVFWFLGLTFSLTWLIDLVIYLGGDYTSTTTMYLVQLSGLMPAFSAILLGLFFFPESPIYHRRATGRGRWFYSYFLLITAIFALVVLIQWLVPAQGTISLVVSNALILLSVLGLLMLIVLRFIAGREAMAQVGLIWGKWRYWLTFSLGFIGFYVLQVILNAYFGLGPIHMSPSSTIPGLSQSAFVIVAFVQMVLYSILGIVIAFGEEYGWRGYLQSKLLKMGRVRGVLLLGVIWGVWHWPVILMGHNYPGHPLLGLVLMALYSVGGGVAMSYAVLKSGSVLLASFLHAINNHVAQLLFLGLGYTPYDSVFSFGLGIYGLATMAIVVLLILCDPIWRGKGSILPSTAPLPMDVSLSSNPGAVEKAAGQSKLGTIE
jgi:membrane protease YdiL (CAAX protease family)